jgi:hypothetical protein
MMEIPIVKAEVLFHFGTLDEQQRGIHMSDSQEGHLLSVSNCPFAWEEIARLGGNPLHSLEAKGPLMLLDVHGVMENESLKAIITEWSINEGLCEIADLWKAWNTNENGEWCSSTYATREEAESECDEMEDCRDNGEPLVEPFTSLVGTQKLADAVKIRDLSTDADSLEFAAILWSEKHVPNLHGAWWNQDLDVYSHSAPRGGIFPEKMAEIEFKKQCRNDVDDTLYPLEFVTLKQFSRPRP